MSQQEQKSQLLTATSLYLLIYLLTKEIAAKFPGEFTSMSKHLQLEASARVNVRQLCVYLQRKCHICTHTLTQPHVLFILVTSHSQVVFVYRICSESSSLLVICIRRELHASASMALRVCVVGVVRLRVWWRVCWNVARAWRATALLYTSCHRWICHFLLTFVCLFVCLFAFAACFGVLLANQPARKMCNINGITGRGLVGWCYSFCCWCLLLLHAVYFSCMLRSVSICKTRVSNTNNDWVKPTPAFLVFQICVYVHMPLCNRQSACRTTTSEPLARQCSMWTHLTHLVCMCCSVAIQK